MSREVFEARDLGRRPIRADFAYDFAKIGANPEAQGESGIGSKRLPRKDMACYY